MKNYSKLGTFASKGRLFKEASNPFRSPFQRNRDRIIHSTSFRRLKHKTQVFISPAGDHYVTAVTIYPSAIQSRVILNRVVLDCCTTISAAGAYTASISVRRVARYDVVFDCGRAAVTI